MLGRPTPLWILGLLGMIGGLLCTIVVLQFAEVIPWAGDEASYIGGRWTGVVIYSFAAGMMYAAGYAWLTIKPWASMITILAALIGFFIPFISHLDGTDPRSSAISPLIVSVLMLFMVFRPSTNRAMALAMSGASSPKAAKSPPPPKPMSAARKRELAAEQKKANAVPAAVTPATAATQPAPAAAKPVAAASPAAPTAPPSTGKSAAAAVLSAASAVRAAAATPASPRRSVASAAKPAAQQKPAAPPASSPASARPVSALRADDV